MSPTARSLSAEFLGTALLLSVIVGSGIAPGSAPAFLAMQLVGGALAAAAALALFPRSELTTRVRAPNPEVSP